MLGDKDTLWVVEELKDPGDIVVTGLESLFGEISSDVSRELLLECCLAIIIDIVAAARAFSSIILLLVSSDDNNPIEELGGVIVLLVNSRGFEVGAVAAC